MSLKLEFDHDDVIVHNVLVTAFGGGHDLGDNGETESGVLNNGSNQNLFGCALPCKHGEAATRGSPLALVPLIPWFTRVKFWASHDEPTDGVMTVLIDNGPNVQRYPDHWGDLTVLAAQVFAPTISLSHMANAFEMRLSYRILGVRYLFNQ